MHPMIELKNRLNQIVTVIPERAEIVYIDYPVYNNGGDMLIMKGTEAFFRSHGIRIRGRYSAMDFPDRLSVPEHCIIVCNGGGNFGDLYEHHQSLRERVVRQYPGNRIVILPQTIYYRDDGNFDRTAALFNRHPDLHLFVRDTVSFELASRKFSSCHLYLCPDMAHQLWPIVPTKKPGQVYGDTLYFLRTDIESSDRQAGARGDAAIDDCRDPRDYRDWDTLFNRFEKRILLEFQRMYRLDKKVGNVLPTRWFWYKYTDYLLSKTIDLFSSYREIQTSRLHGHILACLMDKPHVLIDNSYGKNSMYYRTWTHRNRAATLL